MFYAVLIFLIVWTTRKLLLFFSSHTVETLCFSVKQLFASASIAFPYFKVRREFEAPRNAGDHVWFYLMLSLLIFVQTIGWGAREEQNSGSCHGVYARKCMRLQFQLCSFACFQRRSPDHVLHKRPCCYAVHAEPILLEVNVWCCVCRPTQIGFLVRLTVYTSCLSMFSWWTYLDTYVREWHPRIRKYKRLFSTFRIFHSLFFP